MKLIDGIVMTKVGEDSVAVPTEKAREKLQGVIRLNETANFILEELQAGRDEKQIATDLAANYSGVDMERARSSVRKIIDELRNEGLIVD